MSFFAVQSDRAFATQFKGIAAVLCAALVSTACAGGSGLGDDNFAFLSDKPEATEPAEPVTGTEALMKATEYWGKEYQKKPRDKKTALNYARNLKAMGQKKQALAVLQHAANFHTADKEVAGEYGRLALDLGQTSVAERLLSVADDPTKPDWRIISARGTVLAKKGQYSAALPYYNRALALAPGETSVLNNLALAHMMNGDAKSAEMMLRDAVGKGGPHASKARQNLALALGVQGRYNESTSVGSSVLPKAYAAANTDYLKKMVRLAPADVPAPVPAAAPALSNRAFAKAPLTPEQIIAQATAASVQQSGETVARPVVRTVAQTSAAANTGPSFKPSSY